MNGLVDLYGGKGGFPGLGHENRLGSFYQPPGRFGHGREALVAQLPASAEDGLDVSVYETRMPARFYRIQASRSGAELFALETGTGQEDLVTKVAFALTNGMLGLRGSA